MKLAGLQIRIDQWEHDEKDGCIELRIRVTTADGEEHGLTERIPEDDFVSRFDYIWRRAEFLMRKHIAEYVKAENEEGKPVK